MRNATLMGALALTAMLGPPALGQELGDIKAAKADCDALVAAAPDNWIGWRRDFGNGQ